MQIRALRRNLMNPRSEIVSRKCLCGWATFVSSRGQTSRQRAPSAAHGPAP
jgi:hypothetical protein